jgi:hypothetical protein
MRCKTLVLVLTAGLGSVALAQPGPPPPEDTPYGTTPTYEPDPTPPPQPDPPPQPAPQPLPPPQPIEPDTGADGRPEGVAIGLGFGYAFPTSVQTPNVTSLRLRLAGGLTFEPAFQASNTTTDREAFGMEMSDKSTAVALLTLIRIPVVSRGKFDLEALGFGAFSTVKDNPHGDYNTITTNAFAVGWGVAVGYWFSPHWQVTTSIGNPLVTWSSRKTQIGQSMYDTASSTTLGLIFDPDVTLMLHMYH